MPFAFLIVGLFTGSLFAQTDSHIYKDSAFSCNYQTLSGMLHGKYVSFYKNGVKKSEGDFQFNNRIGEWSVWDSTGKLRAKRIYTNPYEYQRIYPEIPSEGPLPLLSEPIYTLKRDSLDEWEKYSIRLRMVVYQQRDFKFFYASQKQLFFDSKTLFDILYENALKKNFSIYMGKGEDNEFKLRGDISTIDTSKVKLVGFRIKSDWIIDNTRLISENRVLFFTVLAVDKINLKDTIELFSVYATDARKYFAKVKLNYPDLPDYLQNLDDVFFFSCFSFEKYEMTHNYNEVPNSYSIESCITNKVEKENNTWLQFNK